MILPRITSVLAALTASVSFFSPAPASAQVLENGLSDVVNVSLLPGWRDADGTHFAALKFSLAPGWKTYWRAPGDGGVPTRMDWSASSNLSTANTLWPVPEVFRQNGLRSVGYRGEFILPLAFGAIEDGPIEIDGHIDFGVCEEICLPVGIDLHMTLLPDQKTDVVEISAALQNHPLSATNANVKHVECMVTYGDGLARIDIDVDMPPLDGQDEALVIEAANPHLWIAEPVASRNGDTLHGSAEVLLRDGGPFEIDLDQLRMTVITTENAVEIIGCL